ncbi:MAG: hypothetical protein ACYCOO_01765, partial [Chitinophagaceae bacterium]
MPYPKNFSRIWPWIWILLVLVGSCRQGTFPGSADPATITGFDARMGPCEGGIFIVIDGHPNPNGL